MFVMIDKTRKKRPKFFFLLEKLPFFRKFVFSTTFWDLQKCFCVFRSNCQISLWTLTICFLRFVTLDDKGKNGQKTFVNVKTAFNWNVFFLSTSWVPRKGSYLLQNICRNTLCALTSCSLTFVKFEKMGKTRPKSFLHWKGCLSFKHLCFQQPLRS